MTVSQRVRGILKSAELSFELGIINAMRYGPLVHANVPDYAEILLRVFIEEKYLTERRFFNTLADEIDNYLLAHRAANQAIYREVADYFINTRKSFRNPLHHTVHVQGYIIEQREALLCLMKFDDLLKVLFPTVAPNNMDDLNYPCYIRYIRMLYDENLGRGNHLLFQAVIATLRRYEEQDNYVCPLEHDASRLISIRRLFRQDEDTIMLTVLKFRPILRAKIVDLLGQQGKSLTPRQIRNGLMNDPDVQGLRGEEVEACLQFIEGEQIDRRGIIMVVNMRYHLVPL